ncbi:hypothetical protein EVAR_50548_1 [Eumeta japonica]|uniref:Uncharacterized protein n=1 Tax=Eumeta variegata TaxID=151549 RepID=A0A4C1YMJ7_EUMVA|nr:hypothetical protein EVAR_50548_1 [Eumeta japonica]
MNWSNHTYSGNNKADRPSFDPKTRAITPPYWRRGLCQEPGLGLSRLRLRSPALISDLGTVPYSDSEYALGSNFNSTLDSNHGSVLDSVLIRSPLSILLFVLFAISEAAERPNGPRRARPARRRRRAEALHPASAAVASDCSGETRAAEVVARPIKFTLDTNVYRNRYNVLADVVCSFKVIRHRPQPPTAPTCRSSAALRTVAELRAFTAS